MKKKPTAFTLALACLLFTECGRHPPRQPVPACFFIPRSAAHVLHGDDYGGNVKYDVNEPFPASSTIRAIKSHLRSLGWEPRDRDLLNGMLTSQIVGWRTYEDVSHTMQQEVRAWSGEWQDRAGAVVIYSLSYRNAVDPGFPLLAPTNLQVFMVLMPPTLPRGVESVVRKQREQKSITHSDPNGFFSITLPSGSTRWIVRSRVHARSSAPPSGPLLREYDAWYLTREEWEDTVAVWRETDEMWKVLRPMAKKAGAVEATVFACEEPPCKADRGLSYRKDAAGEWVKK